MRMFLGYANRILRKSRLCCSITIAMAGEKTQDSPVITTAVASGPGHDSANMSHAETTESSNAWIRFMTWIHWYPRQMPAAEKSLVLKLDLMILIYGCLCFFTKYLSQASLTNAFVT